MAIGQEALPGAEGAPGAVGAPGASPFAGSKLGAIPGLPGAELSPGADVLGVSSGVNNPILLSPRAAADRLLGMREAFRAIPDDEFPLSVQKALVVGDHTPDLKSFVFKVSADLSKADRKKVEDAESEIEVVRQTPVDVEPDVDGRPELLPADGLGNQLRKHLFDAAGGNIFRPPTSISPDRNAGVISIKTEAIKRGLLPPGTRLDGNWTPELSNAYYVMQEENVGNALAGEERTTARSVEDAFMFLDKWVNPGSLAVSTVGMLTNPLGFFVPDPDAIASETSGWWGKIKDWTASPENFINPRKMFGALGPIDDIVFPLMNSYLMATGMHSLVMFGRAAMATRGVALAGAGATRPVAQAAASNIRQLVPDAIAPLAGQASQGAARASAFAGSGRFSAGVLEDVARLQQPGFIGQQLGNVAQGTGVISKVVKNPVSVKAANSLGNTMEAWRRRWMVNITRKGVAETAKVGFLGQVQNEVSPDRQIGSIMGFGSSEQTADRHLEEFRSFRTENPVGMGLSIGFELMFTPITVFRPGSFATPLKEGIKVQRGGPLGLKAVHGGTGAKKGGFPTVTGKRILPGWTTFQESLTTANFDEVVAAARNMDVSGIPQDPKLLAKIEQKRAHLTALTVKEIDRLTSSGRLAQLSPDGRLNVADMQSLENAQDRITYFMTGDIAALRSGDETVRAAALADADQRMLWMLTNIALDDIAENASRMKYPNANQGTARRREFLSTRSTWEARLRNMSDLEEFDASNAGHLRSYSAQRSSSDAPNFDYEKILNPEITESTVLGANGKPVKVFLEQDLNDIETSFVHDQPGFEANVRLEIGDHQTNRLSHFNELFDNISVPALVQGFEKMMPRLKHWDDWMASVDEGLAGLRASPDGLSVVKLSNEADAAGTPLWAMNVLDAKSASYIPHDADISSLNRGFVDRLGRQTDANRISVTPQKVTTPTAQEARALVRALESMTDARRGMELFQGGGHVEFGEAIGSLKSWARTGGSPDTGADLAKTIDQLTPEDIADWALTFGASKRAEIPQVSALQKEAKEFGTAAQWLAKNKYSLDDPLKELNRRLTYLNEAEWWDNFQVAKTKFEATPGSKRRLETSNGLTNIEDKIGELKEAAPFMGTEVTFPGGVGLSDDKYKLVSGSSFFQMRDLDNSLSVMADLKESALARMSFGLHFTRQETTLGNGLRSVRFRQAMSRRLTESFFDWDPSAGTEGGWVPRVDAAGKQLWQGPENFDPSPYSDSMNGLEKALDGIHVAKAQALASLLDQSTGRLHKAGLLAANATKSFNRFEIDPRTLRGALNTPELNEANRWDDLSVDVLVGAMTESRSIGWEHRGIAEIGDRIAKEGWMRQAMSALKYSDAGDDWSVATKAARVAGIGPNVQEVDIYRHYKAIGVALAMGAFQGADAALDGGDFGDALEGFATGAAIGGAGATVATKLDGRGGIVRTAGRAVAFNQVGGGFENPEEFLRGGLAATFGIGVARGLATSGHKVMVAKGMGQYSKIGSVFEQTRNKVRFALSPIFDAQRYTEGLVLSGATTFKDETGVIRQTPLVLNPHERAISDLQAKKPAWLRDRLDRANVDIDHATPAQMKQALRGAFEDAVKGREWADAITLTDARLAEVGILGFNPFEAMAGNWAQLIGAGMDSGDAVNHVKRVYQYGVTARSGFEQSVNFVWFPFSFQKQYSTRLASFFSEDVGRAMILTNSFKIFQALEERYEFGELVDRHFKGLDQMRKINAVGYGLSPGQFGGINRPYLDFIRKTPTGAQRRITSALTGGLAETEISEVTDAAFNLALPQGIELNTEGDFKEWNRRFEQMVPILRDVKDLQEDTFENLGYITTSPGFHTKQWDKQEGYNKFGQLKDDFSKTAQSLGVSYSTLQSNPKYLSFQEEFKRNKRAIEAEHPEWKTGRAEDLVSATQRASTLQNMKLAPETDVERAVSRFARRIDQMEAQFGVKLDDMPTGLQGQLRAFAIKISADIPGFEREYERFWFRLLGPIELRL